MKLSELVRRAQLVHASSAGGDPDILAIAFDSREVESGTLFVALPGAAVDGHDFIPAAIQRGAVAVLVERAERVPEGVPGVVVEDSRASLAAVAIAFFADPSNEMSTCGITGTNGKTTCSFIIEAIVRERRPVGVIGTVNYRWPGVSLPAPNTTPENLVAQNLLRRMADDGVEVGVMEVSSHGLETHRVDGLKFDVVLFTNFSQDHLDFHESMQAYLEAKLRLFGPVLERSIESGKAPTAVVNVDDPAGHHFVRAARASQARVVTFGRQPGADVSISDVKAGVDGSTFVTQFGDERSVWRTGLLGDFNVLNSVGAMLCARALGVDDEAIARGLARLDGVPGRLQRVAGRFFVDYAHTPDALSTVLRTLRGVTSDDTRIITLVGAGGDRDTSKRPKMGAAAAAGSDVVVVTNDNPRSEDPQVIADAIVAGVPAGKDVHVILDRRGAINWAVSHSGPNDVVLVAGKGHETYQEFAGVRREFDDVAELKRALEEG